MNDIGRQSINYQDTIKKNKFFNNNSTYHLLDELFVFFLTIKMNVVKLFYIHMRKERERKNNEQYGRPYERITFRL